MTTYTATYSPDDNKLRLYASTRLDSETYARVKAAGFKWAPKQELFVAPMWTPYREDLLIELAGEIGDEDTSLVDRAEERAERFEEYGDKRLADAERARKGVAEIADNIPFGQPILVGHHSEKRARKDQERIENGMRKAVKMWETSKYWTSRAAGAVRAAKYKELPAVRHRRIKGIEADQRKATKNREHAVAMLKLWSSPNLTFDAAKKLANAGYISFCFPVSEYPRPEGASTYEGDMGIWSAMDAGIIDLAQAVQLMVPVYQRTIASNERWLPHYANRLAYEKAMLAEQLGTDASANPMADRFDLKVGGSVLVSRDEWVVILRLNKKDGVVNSISTTPPRAVTWQKTWKYGVEEIKEYRAPTAEQEDKVKKATKLPPLCNYPGDGFREMTQAEWDARHKWSDFSYVGTIKATDTTGAHRRRQMPKPDAMWERVPVFITDAKRVDPPKKQPEPDPKAENQVNQADSKIIPDRPAAAPLPEPRQIHKPEPTVYDAMKQQLKNGGVQVVVAPQLFPTPEKLASDMVELADIQPGDDILEPSGGTGRIIRAILAKTGKDHGLVAVEIKPHLADVIRTAYRVPTHCRDFLECAGFIGTFDKILMNPPFENGADIKHIMHARQFLKPGGRIVAICADGPRQNEKLRPLATDWIPLPAGTFKESGTNVNTVLLVIDAPATIEASASELATAAT